MLVWIGSHSVGARPLVAWFAGSPDIRRELMPGSLEAYPIPGYGAMEIGTHRFCHTEAGTEVCGTFGFLQIWRLVDGAWKVTREVSYGH